MAELQPMRPCKCCLFSIQDRAGFLYGLRWCLTPQSNYPSTSAGYFPTVDADRQIRVSQLGGWPALSELTTSVERFDKARAHGPFSTSGVIAPRKLAPSKAD